MRVNATTALGPSVLPVAALGTLCRDHGVARLEVFGSAGTVRFDPARSDYDFIVRFAAREEESLAARYLALADALERLLGAPVDLMTDHPLNNPYLQASVEATRRVVYDQQAAQASV